MTEPEQPPEKFTPSPQGLIRIKYGNGPVKVVAMSRRERRKLTQQAAREKRRAS